MGDALSDLLASDQDEPGDLEGTLQRIAAAAHTVFSADLCTLFAINPITGRFLVDPIVYGERLAPAEALPPPREKGLTREVLQRKLLLVDEPEAQPLYRSAFSRAEGVRCFAALALETTRQPKPLAVLYVDFRAPQPLEELREALARFAQESSRQLQSTWFLRRYRSVAKIGQEVNRKLESHLELFRMVHAHLGGILDISHGLLLAIHQPPTSTLDLYANISGQEVVETGKRSHQLSGLCGLVMRSGRYFLRETSAGELPAPLERLRGAADSQDPAALLYVPLQLGGEALGVIAVQHRGAFAFDQEDRHILELLANHLALALDNLRLFAGLRHLNQAGQLLTRHLEAEDVQQRVVKQISSTAESDVAVLYSYVQVSDEFERPARVAGELRDPDQPQRGAERRDDMAWLAVTQEQPEFAPDSRTLYQKLGGDPRARRGNFEEREGIRSTAVLPLRVADEPVGVLFVNYRSPQSFEEVQRLLLSGLASYAAIAIKNAREYGALASRNLRRLKLLQEIDRRLNRTADLKQLLHAILDLAAAHFHSHAAAVVLYDSNREELKIEAATGARAEQREGMIVRLAEGRGINAHVVREKTAVLVPDIRASGWNDLFKEMGSSTRAEMDVPILDDHNQVVGVLNFESEQPAAFGPEDLNLVLTLAGQAVLAVKKAQAFEAERRLASERQTLIDLGKEITRQLEVDKVLGLVVERAREITQAKAAILLLRRGEQLVVRAQSGNPSGSLGRAIRLSEGIVGMTAREGRSINVADVDHPDWREVHLRVVPGTRSELAVPLKLEGPEPAIRGVLEVESPDVGHFGEGDRRLLEDLADLTLVALQNAERYEKAEERRDRLKALHRVGHQIIRSPEEPDRVLEAVLEQALQLAVTARIADLDLYEHGQLATTFVARRDEHTGAIKHHQKDHRAPGATPSARGIMARVMQTCLPYRTGSAGTDPHYVPGDLADRVESELAVPLKRDVPGGREELIGVLNVESTLPDAFDADDQEVLEVFAAEAVVALENARNFKRAVRRQRRFEALSRAVSRLGEIDDEERLGSAYQFVVQIAEEYFNSQVVVRRLDVQKGQLVRKAFARHDGIPPFPSMPLGRGLNGQVAQERRTILVPDADNPPPGTWTIERSDPKVKSLAVTPIQFGASYYGNLSLSHEKRNYFRNTDTTLLEGLAKELAVTIQRVEKIKENQETAQRAADAAAMSWFAENAIGVTHDLGNDLGLVPRRIVKIRHALEAGKTSSIYRELDMIGTGVSRVLNLSKQLKEMVKTGRAAAARVPAREILKEVCASFQPSVRKVSVRPSLPEDLGEVEVVHGEIESALRQLLMNAQVAMPRGGVITVAGESDEREVRLRVEDTGQGIPEENLEKIWLPRFSTNKSSGFGLFTARSMVLRNGGIINVSSVVGKGSTFTIHLPRADRGSPEDVAHGL
jgi:GAF domain-containing protein